MPDSPASRHRLLVVRKVVRGILGWHCTASTENVIMSLSRLVIASCTEAERAALDLCGADAIPLWVTKDWLSLRTAVRAVAFVVPEDSANPVPKQRLHDRAFDY